MRLHGCTYQAVIKKGKSHVTSFIEAEADCRKWVLPELLVSLHRFPSNSNFCSGKNDGIKSRNTPRPLAKVPIFVHGFL